MARHQEDVGARGQMRKEAALLNDVTDPAAQHIYTNGRNRRAVESDCARIGCDQPDDESQQRRFAATARSDQHRCFATFDRKIRRMQSRSAGVILRNFDELNQCAHQRLICHGEIENAKQTRMVGPHSGKLKPGGVAERRESFRRIFIREFRDDFFA